MRSHIVWFGLLSGLTFLTPFLTVGCSPGPTATVKTGTVNSNTAASEPRSLKIIGASTPYPAIDLLAEAFTKQSNSDVRFTFLDSSQSSGGIEAVKDKFVDIGTVTRSPKPKEVSPHLTYREVAKDALVVAIHPSVSNINNLTTQNLKDIYSGTLANWKALGGPDAKIIVLDRAEDTSAKRLLREYYLGSDLPNASDAVVLRRESEIIDAIQNTPHSVGVLSLAKAIAQLPPIQHISLDGIAPTSENISSGTYAMHRNLGIVWSGPPSPTTQSFIDFIFSPQGQTVLRQAGYAPSAENSPSTNPKD